MSQNLQDVFPLSDSEDGLLIVLDRDSWTLRIYYEGIERPPEDVAAIIDTAKKMYLEEKAAQNKPPSNDMLN